MASPDVQTASAIADVDQRRAALDHIRELTDRNTRALVDTVTAAILEAQAEMYEEVSEQLRDEEAEILSRETRGK